MKEYRIKYQVTGVGQLVFRANSAEEAEEEFYRIMCGDAPQIEENDWIDDDNIIYDLEYENEILDTEEE